LGLFNVAGTDHFIQETLMNVEQETIQQQGRIVLDDFVDFDEFV